MLLQNEHISNIFLEHTFFCGCNLSVFFEFSFIFLCFGIDTKTVETIISEVDEQLATSMGWFVIAAKKKTKK